MDGDVFGPYSAKGMMELDLLPDIMVTEVSMDVWQPAEIFDFAALAKQEVLERLQSTPTNNTPTIIGSENDNKFDRFNYKHEVYRIDEMGCVIFNDVRIRNTINEIINESTSNQTYVSASQGADNRILSDDEMVVLSYAFICLKSGVNYVELKRVLDHIDDFEQRFPSIANSLCKQMDNENLMLLRRQILKAKMIGAFSEKANKISKTDRNLGPTIITDSETIQIPRSRGIITPSQVQPANDDNAPIVDREKDLKEKRELLKKKLLAGEHIDFKSTSRPSESDQSINIPRGGLV